MFDRPGAVFKDQVQIDQDFVQGDKTTIEKLVVHIYGNQASPQFSDAELQDQLAEYLRYIRETYRYLDFKGIDGIAEAVKGSSGLTLEAVYVPLRARLDRPDGESWHRLGGRCFRGAKVVTGANAERLEKEMERAEASALTVEQWIKDRPALLVLGDPGSGKSTTLKRLALGLAQCENNAPLPLLLPLNAYSKALEKRELSFEAYLPEYFHAKRAQLDPHKLQQLFNAALQQGKAVILMDGLDEVGDNRGQVVAQVENFVRAWIPDPHSKNLPPKHLEAKQGSNRMVVTSRFVGYRDYPLRDPRWQTVALNDWNRAEIERFFSAFTLASELAWSGGANRESAERDALAERQALLRVIDDNAGIRRLAGNPLLASLLALIKRQGVTLPHRRVELYKLYMETLLRSWNRARSLDRQPIGPDIDFSPTQRLLAKLALHLRQTNPQGGLIHEDAMRDYLVQHYEADGYTHKEAVEQARGFLDSVHKYSNLLIEKGHRQYGFIHLTFEEYLAGFGLALLPEAVLQKKIHEYLQKPEHWRETLLLALGVAAVVNNGVELANALLKACLDSRQAAQILFAGTVLNDVGATALGNRMAQQIKLALLALGQSLVHNIAIRRQAGWLLGDSGWLPDDLDSFIKIPQGSFLSGDAKTPTTIRQDYWIAKYPVTNAQYRRFIDAGSYGNRAYWCERGWKWREKENWRQPESWEDSRWNNPLSPVVGVSWYEASAYCRWLQEQVQAQPQAYGLTEPASPHWAIRLPGNDEWERAARGIDGRKYPWGDAFCPECTNCYDSYCYDSWGKAVGGERGTTAVCLFPQGASPDGIWDCGGNAWEWSSSRDKDHNPYIRGGCWNFNSDIVRCAVRDRRLPTNRYDYLGFRVVCVEVLPDSEY